jgi:single-stranded DNA-binding protein
MSSIYACVATVVQDPESLELGGKSAVKLRLVDKALSKRHEDRFFNAILFGYDAETAARLARGDQIFISGTLALTSYTSKKTKQKVQADEMGFGTRIMRVLKSPTFFGEASKEAPADEPAFDPTSSAGVAGVAGPLDDLDL